MIRPPRRLLAAASTVAALLLTTAALEAQSHESAGLDRLDPVAELMLELEDGTTTLAYDSAWGYLPSLLESLEIPVSSQGLIFSRTSLQTDRIAPWAPRAVYFNDDVYVGAVQESPTLEIATVDPDDGARFYTLAQNPVGGPTFQLESNTCLMCHESKLTGGVPGFLMLSTLADRSGYPLTEFHAGSTTHATPVKDRWGGWYVTGDIDGGAHAGNVRSRFNVHEVDDRTRHVQEMRPGPEALRSELDEFFYVDGYPSQHSDIVALLVLTHQVHVHNLMSAATAQTAEALQDQRAMVSTTGVEIPATGYLPMTRARIEKAAEELVEGLLLAQEAELEGPVSGTSGFSDDFQALGPFDSRGRTLRSLDLETRLFTYPMSFLVYSDAFAALPVPLKEVVLQRLWEVLDRGDAREAFHHLSGDRRQEIHEILMDTQPDYRLWVQGQETNLSGSP